MSQGATASERFPRPYHRLDVDHVHETHRITRLGTGWVVERNVAMERDFLGGSDCPGKACVMPLAEAFLPSACAYSRAVGELAPDEEISSLLKVTLDNTVIVDLTTEHVIAWKLRYAFAPTLAVIMQAILDLEAALVHEEKTQKGDAPWRWSPRAHINGGLYVHPKDGGPTRLRTFEYRLVDLAQPAQQLISLFTRRGSDGKEQIPHWSTHAAWPRRHVPPLPHLHLPLSLIKASVHFWTSIQPLLSLLVESTDPYAQELLELALHIDYFLRLVESETPSQWRTFLALRPTGLPAPPDPPALLNQATRKYVLEEWKILATPTSDASLAAFHASLAYGQPAVPLVNPGAELFPEYEPAVPVPPSLVVLTGAAFGAGELLIYPNMPLSAALLAQLQARIEQGRREMHGMSPSEALRYLRTRDGREYAERRAWMEELREWQEENGFMNENVWYGPDREPEDIVRLVRI